MLSSSIFRLLSLNLNTSNRSISHFITTPIFYVNSSPHIGHVHTLFLADALNIFSRLKLRTSDTILSTGTDEHGIKIQSAADNNKILCRDFCDLNAAKFSNLFKQYDTTLTDFIRTTEDRHRRCVEHIWNELDKNGFIFKSTYSGWYCASDEVFVPELQVTSKKINGQLVHVDQNDNQVVWSSEMNYMFRLSKVEDKVIEWLSREKPVIPGKFNDELLRQLERSRVGDISISRPKTRLSWGIEVPNDSSQTIYVWLDALSNYLTVAGYLCDVQDLRRWPIDCQILGKDILKFHALYWPAFLIALSLPLPKRLICHSHWLVDSIKMSKSKENVVDPWQENQLLTLEGLRYYLLRASTTHSDTDYNRIQAVRRVNAELADTYGNLMSRCCAHTINPTQTVPTNFVESDDFHAINELVDKLNGLASVCDSHFSRADFYKGVDEIMSVLRLNNRLYEEAQPWKLVKTMHTDPSLFKKYHNLQVATFETLRVSSMILQPIIPKLSKIVLDHIGVQERFWEDATVRVAIGEPESAKRTLQNQPCPVLFKRIKS